MERARVLIFPCFTFPVFLLVSAFAFTSALGAPGENLTVSGIGAGNLGDIRERFRAYIAEHEARSTSNDSNSNIEAQGKFFDSCYIKYGETWACEKTCCLRPEDITYCDDKECIENYKANCHHLCYPCWCEDDLLACCLLYPGTDCGC